MHLTIRQVFLLSILIIPPLGLIGCDSESFLEGRWTLTDPDLGGLDTRGLGCEGSEAECTVYPELIFGHFGEEVVGVIRYFEDAKRHDEMTCTQCGGCQSIAENDFDGEELIFRYKPCKGQNYNQKIVTDSTTVTWSVLNEKGDLVQTLEFTKSSHRPNSAEKVCTCK